MSNDPKHLQLFSIDPATRAALGRVTRRDHCVCLSGKTKKGAPLMPELHVDEQDENAAGWRLTKALIDHTVLSGDSLFEPSAHMPWEDWMQVVTLPPALASLTKVTRVTAYGSHLRRLPPEIGRMSSLADLDIYTSYSLHWLPYEVTRCSNLRESRMSTRALYGNRKTLLPFPRLSRPIPALVPNTCSVCDRAFEGRSPRLFWTTQWIGTDHVPLLIHSCSDDCIASVPSAPRGFFARPHKGGGGVGMPDPAYWEALRRPRPPGTPLS